MGQQSGPLGADVAVTQILVVADPAAARNFWVDVLGAELYREYGRHERRAQVRWDLAFAGDRRRPDRRQARGSPPGGCAATQIRSVTP
jgi:catechol 2,3-dioxygenase-like lactoylglutathione lyase family enzyme